MKPDSYRYQWYFNGTAVKDATGSTFVTPIKIGDTVRVNVTAVGPGSATMSRTSTALLKRPGYWAYED